VPVRVLLLTTCYPSHEQDPSGVFLDRLAVALARIGYEVEVLTPSDGMVFGKRVVNGIDTFRFGYFWPRSAIALTRGLGGIPENLARSRLARMQVLPMMALFLVHSLLRMRRSDLIYANWLGAGIIGAVMNLITGKPLVVSFRGDDGYLARDKGLWRILTQWVCGRASVVAPVSEEIREILVQLGVPRDKVVVPRFGVDLELFHPAGDRIQQSDRLTVAFVGSLITKKGPQDLIEALKDPELNNINLVFVGDGILRDKLTEKCRQAGLTGRVEWQGLRSQKEVAATLRSCDILCLPSYAEGKPNVIKEAMASGLPVVATRVGGIGELIADRVTGRLFAPGNVLELRECLKALAADRDLRTRMGKAGLERIQQQGASWDAAAQEFDGIFRGALARSDRSGVGCSTGSETSIQRDAQSPGHAGDSTEQTARNRGS
jgi:L-malate glycosyltransferase